MKLLAVDPGLGCTGIALFEGDQVSKVFKIKTKLPKKTVLDIRRMQIASAFSDILVLTQPDCLAIESQYMGVNVKAMSKLVEVKGILQGVYFAYCFAYKKPFSLVDVTPLEAKQAVGVRKKLKRGESKLAVKEAVLRRFPQFSAESEQKEDIFDAIAIGCAGGFKLNLQKS